MTLRHVPPDVIDQDMCRDALRQAVSFGLGSLRLLLPVIPEQLFDEEMCEMAMDADPFAIKYLPPDLMTAEKYEEAIERAASEEGRRPRTS